VARLSLENLPAYAILGSTLSGVLVLETDQPLRATDITLTLRGQEHTQATVQQGKSSAVYRQSVSFLELAYSFRNEVSFSDPDHVAAGSYRCPFQFVLPLTGTPSIATSELPRQRGRFFGYPDGAFVEYELEARVEVPWWISPVDREVIPVYSPRRVLGAPPRLQSVPVGDHPSIVVQLDPPMILPGNSVTGSYQVSNPGQKHVRSVTVSLGRRVLYHAQGVQRQASGPVFSATIPYPERQTYATGTLAIDVPNISETTGPWQGQLFATYWMLSATLDIALGFNVALEVPLIPA
jgi:arrestin (S-antigen)-like protein